MVLPHPYSAFSFLRGRLRTQEAFDDLMSLVQVFIPSR